MKATGLDNSTPPVSIVRPVCGLEKFFRTDFAFDLRTRLSRLRSPVLRPEEEPTRSFRWPRNCWPNSPKGRGKLLIGDDRISPNPKLNNCVKGWQAARHQWVVLADSNVLAPKDYLQQMLVRFTPDCRPRLFAAARRHAAGRGAPGSNAPSSTPIQARWQFAPTRSAGLRPGQEHDVAARDRRRAGGMVALASEIAEDAASTKLVRSAGMKVALVDRPFDQPLGRRNLRAIYRRQTRWARLRRASFPSMYVPEIFAGTLLPSLAGAYAAREFGFEPWTVVALVVAAFVIPEIIANRLLRWPSSLWSPLGYIFRDLLFAVIWIDGWLGDDFVWLGNSMTVREAGRGNRRRGVKRRASCQMV